MKGIIYCVIGTFLVLCFAKPMQFAQMVNPTDRIPFDVAQGYVKTLTGFYPNCVPVIVLGSATNGECATLHATLQQRGVAFSVIDVIANPQARPIMNQIGKQSIPTTIVGTHLISGNDPDGVVKALIEEQKSLKWPQTVTGGAAHSVLPDSASTHASKAAKHGHAAAHTAAKSSHH